MLSCGCLTWRGRSRSGAGCSAGSATCSSKDWPDGRSWRLATTYLVIEQSPALSARDHDRLRPGLNHLAFHAGTRQDVGALAAEGPAHRWTLLFPAVHPYAGGPGHYAAYLASADGFEVELVARPALYPRKPGRPAAG